ncbi:MAG TPA: type 1 glutamine amidotransferase, partial [Burkholderiales bacterium]|nr:type 1 glutamine amidotransferase [Burkholderiales bacterium]
MKPVAIFRHARTEGAGFLSDYLTESGIPWKLYKVDEADSIPDSASIFSGIVFMGGPMSVNDDLPWIPLVLELIRDAVGKGIPVLGHCLGGQLMAKALGGEVAGNPSREIGWGKVDVIVDAEKWFGGLGTFEAFHWHGETFSIP